MVQIVLDASLVMGTSTSLDRWEVDISDLLGLRVLTATGYFHVFERTCTFKLIWATESLSAFAARVTDVISIHRGFTIPPIQG